jgi:hypothetical protein
MKSRMWIGALTFALMLAILPRAARADEAMTAGGMEPASMLESNVATGPLNKLLKDKNLALNPDQIKQIEAIKADLKAKNQPLKDKIHATPGAPAENMNDMKNMTKEQRKKAAEEHQAWRKQHPELDPTFKEIKANRQAAWQQATAVLTPDQLAVVNAKMGEMKGKAGGMGKSGKTK